MEEGTRQDLIRRAKKGKRKISAFEIEQVRRTGESKRADAQANSELRGKADGEISRRSTNQPPDHLQHIPARVAERLAAELGGEVTPLRAREWLRDTGEGFTQSPADSGDPRGPLPPSLTDMHALQLTSAQLRQLIRALGGQPPREDLFLKTALLELLS